MPLQPGGDKFAVQRLPYESDGTSEPGDAVTLDGGTASAAGEGDEVHGVHAHGSIDANAPEDGDQIPVIVAGVTAANVADGTVAGELLAGSAVVGELATGTQDGKSLLAMSDKEAAMPTGNDVDGSAPAGTAFVEVR